MTHQRPSVEQQEAIDAAVRGENVRVMAAPGAGKTFACLRMAESLEAAGFKVVQLTYSAALKLEWRARRMDPPDSLGYPHSFHSFASFVAARAGSLGGKDRITDDASLRALLLREPGRLPEALVADVVVIDETQDFCTLFLELLRWYQRACGGRTFQLIVVGQADQCVYKEGKGGRSPEDTKARLSFLTDDDAFGGLVAGGFTEVHFTRSFRLTPLHAAFVNRLCGTAIVGANVQSANRCPVWFCCNIHRHAEVAGRIEDFLRRYEKVQLVTGSLKETSKAAFKHIRNCLSAKGWLFADQGDKETSNKFVCYTCCGVKGTESTCSIVVGADSFSNYVTREQRFVALTRAQEQLVVFQHYENAPWFAESPNEIRAAGADVRYLEPFARCDKESEARSVHVVDLLRSAEVLGRLVDAYSTCTREEMRGVDGRAPATVDLPMRSVGFGTHSESLEHVYGILSTFEFAIRRVNLAPGFDRIFDQSYVVDSKKNGGGPDVVVRDVASALQRDGIQFPERASFLEYLRKRRLGERETVVALKTHFEKHGMAECARKLIPAREYQKIFPLSEKHALDKLKTKGSGAWTADETAHAAIAAGAYDGQHQTLAQIMHYRWATTGAHRAFLDVCCERLNGLLNEHGGDAPSEEYECGMSWWCAARDYVDSPYKITGIKGVVDCLMAFVVFEFKTKGKLETCDFVQLFLYLLLVAHVRKLRPDSLTGILFNCRTNERYVLRLRKDVDVETVLSLVLDIHFDKTRTPDAILGAAAADAAATPPSADADGDGSEGDDASWLRNNKRQRSRW